MTQPYRVLVADDTLTNRRLLAAVFKTEGFDVTLAEDGKQALAAATAALPHVALLDLHMPVMNGLETLEQLKKLAPNLPVIMLTAHGDIPTAVDAIRLGAYDFLTRPINNDKLVLTVKRAIERLELMGEVQVLRQKLAADSSLVRLMGPSSHVRRVIQLVEQVAESMLTVLVQGETGTGKELVARAIHQGSDRRAKPFVAIDCGAIPENLLESELFGYEKGAFSGADRRKEGYLQIASGGTLFLDEIGNLTSATQAKFLRVLQERIVYPLGSTKSVPLDVRIIAATNEALEDKVREGKFRQDLYFRLVEFSVLLPPLRDRREDVRPLALRFQEEAVVELRRSVSGIDDAAMVFLEGQPWPGNVRQLRNVIRQAVISTEHPTLQVSDFERLMGARGGSAPTPAALATVPLPAGASLKEIADAAADAAEKQAILETLRITKGNKSQAARQLKVDFKTLHAKMRRFGIQRGTENEDEG